MRPGGRCNRDGALAVPPCGRAHRVEALAMPPSGRTYPFEALAMPQTYGHDDTSAPPSARERSTRPRRGTTSARATVGRIASGHSLCPVRGSSERCEAERVLLEGRALRQMGIASASKRCAETLRGSGRHSGRWRVSRPGSKTPDAAVTGRSGTMKRLVSAHATARNDTSHSKRLLIVAPPSGSPATRSQEPGATPRRRLPSWCG